MNQSVYEPIKLITCIVNRGEGKHVTELCTAEGLHCHLLIHGRGTADNAMLAMLGLGENEKDIIFLTVAASKQVDIMEKITSALRLNESGRGIAFSIPLSSLASQMDSYETMAGLRMASVKTNEEGLEK